MNFKHGMHGTPEYKSWNDMKQRCGNPNDTGYKYYGGRGIGYDPRWESFENFYLDMGDKPSREYQLERENNNEGYSKDNCYWATSTENNSNTRRSVKVTYQGEEITVSELSRRTGVSRQNLGNRLRAGWTLEEAIAGVR